MKRIFPPRGTKPSPERSVGCAEKVQLLYQDRDNSERDMHNEGIERKYARNESSSIYIHSEHILRPRNLSRGLVWGMQLVVLCEEHQVGKKPWEWSQRFQGKKKGKNMAELERDGTQPPINWVDTTAGGENDPGDASVVGSPGSGADDNTRAGLPNADPDGYDLQRSDLKGIDLGENPTGDDA